MSTLNAIHSRNLARAKGSVISVVVPCYNEASNIPFLAEQIKKNLEGLEFNILFVNDGSSDNSLEVLEQLHHADKRIKYIALSRNFGHQSALLAGLHNASGDCVISMDGDLQHPPELLPVLIDAWLDGFEVVATIRNDIHSKSYIKKHTSRLFYKAMNKLSAINIEEGTADFRLLDRRVVEVLRQFNEANVFLRGIIKWIGFRQKYIRYEPASRFSGTSKYSLKKMVTLALDGITSFSVRPLHLATLIGFFISTLSGIYGMYVVLLHFSSDYTVSGWASIIISVLFLGGIQLLMLGVLGEYLGKLFIQSKGRPSYLISSSKGLHEKH